MKAAELRKLNKEDILKKIEELEISYLQLRCEHGIGMLKNSSLLRKKRKDIAISKTIYNELTRSN